MICQGFICECKYLLLTDEEISLHITDDQFWLHANNDAIWQILHYMSETFFAVLAPIFAAMNLTILPNFLFIPVLWLSVQFLNHVLHQARPLVLQLVQDHSEIEIKGIFKRNQIKNILSNELIHAFIKQHWTNNLYV